MRRRYASRSASETSGRARRDSHSTAASTEGGGFEVVRRESHPQLGVPPRLEAQRRQRLRCPRRTCEALRCFRLHDEVNVVGQCWDARRLPQDLGGEREGDVAGEHERLARQVEREEVRLDHLHQRFTDERLVEITRQSPVQFDCEHAAAATRKGARQQPAAGTDLDDERTGRERAVLDEPLSERSAAQEVLTPRAWRGGRTALRGHGGPPSSRNSWGPPACARQCTAAVPLAAVLFGSMRSGYRGRCAATRAGRPGCCGRSRSRTPRGACAHSTAATDR